jgi:hypothetical protein
VILAVVLEVAKSEVARDYEVSSSGRLIAGTGLGDLGDQARSDVLDVAGDDDVAAGSCYSSAHPGHHVGKSLGRSAGLHHDEAPGLGDLRPGPLTCDASPGAIGPGMRRRRERPGLQRTRWCRGDQ